MRHDHSPSIRPAPGGPRRQPVFLFAIDPLLDSAAAERAIEAFRNVRGSEPVVWLDLSAVAGVSAAGIETLGSFAEGAGARRATVRLIGVTPALRAALRGTALERYVWRPPLANA